MKSFASLYAELDTTNSTRAKLEAMKRYFATVDAADAAWALYFLAGNRPRQVVPTKQLRALILEAASIPDWLFEECYQAVGDLAETIAHLLPDPGVGSGLPLTKWVEERLLPMRGMEEAMLRETLLRYWSELNDPQRFAWNKLITGAFRVGVSKTLVIRAIAEVAGLDAKVVAERLAGDWQPDAEHFKALIAAEHRAGSITQPYPFFLAHPLQDVPETLGDVGGWQIEWKWDGIRAQLIKRQAQAFIWSRGEELITDRFPEIVQAAQTLSDGSVLDGEILAWDVDKPFPFARLQRRIGRKTLTAKVLSEAPAVLLAYDLLEYEDADIRQFSLTERRNLLEELVERTGHPALRISPMLDEGDWRSYSLLREQSRDRGVEGFMLKRGNSTYGVGRPRGDWWKWKIDPYRVDAVLIYAQRGHGRRASLYTDYTFALWRGDQLVPFAKAYSGLTDEEIREVDAFIRTHTLEKFGPVRSVTPQLVFEIGFEAIQRSTRHKSGIAVRFPRILRRRPDKRIEEADSLETLNAMASSGA
ncbi:MAG TPA: ATP-dependent DNA ligase [Burkholderiales bacterium]|nr:ATP-dependent DNA ligase [Burkholderiales bacterium]